MQYEKIVQYFKYLESTYNIYICVKDFSGFIPVNKELHTAFAPFMAHNHSFCTYIKKDTSCYLQCLSMIPKIMKKCLDYKEAFYGTCHAGISEYVLPIVKDDNVLGAFTIGCYVNFDTDLKKRIFELKSKFPDLDISTMTEHMHDVPTPKKCDIDSVLLTLELIASFLASSNSVDIVVDTAAIGKKFQSKKTDILFETIIQYIKDHISEQIKLEDVAHFCNYSTSYISRNFNKVVGMSFNTYVNKMRIEISKNYLSMTDKTIVDIATTVGFDDSSYYCKVFQQLLSMTPTEFRKKFYKDSL